MIWGPKVDGGLGPTWNLFRMVLQTPVTSIIVTRNGMTRWSLAILSDR